MTPFKSYKFKNIGKMWCSYMVRDRHLGTSQSGSFTCHVLILDTGAPEPQRGRPGSSRTNILEKKKKRAKKSTFLKLCQFVTSAPVQWSYAYSTYMYCKIMWPKHESIKIRFHQPGYQLYSHLEQLIVLAANGKEYAQHVEAVSKFYGNDLDSSLLRTQLDNLKCYFNTRESTTIVEVIAGIRSMSPAQRSFFSEVCSVTRLVLVMPATNAASERSFSCMRRLKIYL